MSVVSFVIKKTILPFVRLYRYMWFNNYDLYSTTLSHDESDPLDVEVYLQPTETKKKAPIQLLGNHLKVVTVLERTTIQINDINRHDGISNFQESFR